MTKAYFDCHGMEVQYNVVDAKTLRDAQKHPEEYHNLVVRIAGFSAYFTRLKPTMQDEVIARTPGAV